jgi:aerobic-type carbon monoxide dehydrogenase small subunit (CoxS/CutS family)
MKQVIVLQVNGEEHEVAVDLDATLLQALREDLGLLGTKRGCDSGGCGSCTVLADGKAVYSCMTYALSVHDKQITTIEGLVTDGRLDPLQEAFVNAGAVQCGYCTCGMIMTARQLLNEEAAPDEERIRHAIAGNLCRCTGYHKIVEAIGLAARGDGRIEGGERT